MKSIKTFDYFQKISFDVSKPTVIGASISIIAFILMSFLLIQEIFQFLTPVIKNDTILYQDESENSKLKVHFSLFIPNAPCSILSVDQEDKYGSHNTNIKENIIKQRISKSNSDDNLPSINPYITESMIKSLNEGEGCSIHGFVEINKVPGNIHISFHPFRSIHDYLVEEQPEVFKKLKLNHKLSSLHFGDHDIPFKTLNSYGIRQFIDMPNFILKDNEEGNFDYFVKIVPHLLKDDASDKTQISYQYSMNYSNRKREGNEMAMIMINYDMSEVTTLITKKKNSFPHFLTHVCAIVGGVFVILSILNRILIVLSDFFVNRDK